MATYPAHVQRAKWQSKQVQHLKEHLPAKTILGVHDFAENYRATNCIELQSQYFLKCEVTIHVSLLYRHIGSEIITEQFIVISQDLKHDSYFVREVQKLIRAYFQEQGAEVHF